MGRPRRNPDDEIMVAVVSGVLQCDGEHQITKGITRARRGHPIVKAAPEWWRVLDVHYEIEQATAAPGELRGEA